MYYAQRHRRLHACYVAAALENAVDVATGRKFQKERDIIGSEVAVGKEIVQSSGHGCSWKKLGVFAKILSRTQCVTQEVYEVD